MTESTQTVYVVDDDISVRQSLESLISSAGWAPRLFASAEEFLAGPRELSSPSCLVLDVNLPDLNGLELQERVADEVVGMPVIFISGFGDVPKTVRAMKGGALEFLTKPFRPDVLLSAVEQALSRSHATLADAADTSALRDRFKSLTPREQEVMALVVSGRLNKQVGGDLGISEITVKAHRGKAMQKMKARTLPDLVRMAAKLNLGRHPLNRTVGNQETGSPLANS